jgi:hypothetical protein
VVNNFLIHGLSVKWAIGLALRWLGHVADLGGLTGVRSLVRAAGGDWAGALERENG